jgi:carbamate kinase
MAQRIRQITKEDKLFLAGTLHAAGFGYRLRVIRSGIRAVVDADFDRQALADALNAGGFRMAAGVEFSRFSFNGNEAFVRGVVA